MKGHMTGHRSNKCYHCQEGFKNQTDLNHHIQRVHSPETHSCKKCKKKFKAKNSLKQHLSTQHPINPPVGHQQWAEERNVAQGLDYCCNQCAELFETLPELRKHKKDDHEGQSFSGFTTVTRHKRGAHEPSQHRQPVCTRGQQCNFLAWGTCHFFHPGVGVQQLRKQAMVRKKCHFQEKCWHEHCSFEHQDFTMRTQFLENY